MATAPVDFDGLLALSGNARFGAMRQRLLQTLNDEELNGAIIHCLMRALDRRIRTDIAAFLLDEVVKVSVPSTSGRRSPGAAPAFGK